MGALRSLARRSLLARPLRSLLTVLGIGLGVAVLVAAVATNAGLDAAVERSVGDLMGRADLRIAAVPETGLSDASVAAVSATSGVAVAAPELEARTYPLPTVASGAAALPGPVTVLGIDPAADSRVHDRPLAAGTGLPVGRDDAALVSEELARADGLSLGGTITLNGAGDGGPAKFTIVGLLADRAGPDQAGRTVVVAVGAAQALFAASGVTRVDVVLAPGADVVTVTRDLEASLTREPYLLSTPADVAASLRASTADFRATIALVATIALFGGAFLIFNMLAMSVAERVRDVGLLRAAGMTRRHVTTLVLFQASYLGVGGVAVGLGLGIALAAVAAAVLGPGGTPAVGELVLPPGGLALAVVIGLLVTLAAALEPAFRAGAISPVEALRLRADVASAVRARLRWLVVIFVVVGGAGLLLWPGEAGAGLARPAAVFGLLLAVALAVPVLLGPLGRLLAIPFAPFFRIEERLTRGALVRDRSRTALTVGALAIGVAVLVALGAVAATTRAAAGAWLADVVPGNELLTSVRPVALDEPALEDLRAVAGVAQISPIGRFSLAASGLRLDAAAVNGSDMAADGRLTFVGGNRASALAALDAGGAVILPRSRAEQLGIGLGGALEVRASGATVPLRVVGIVERSIPGSGGEAILVGWTDATERLGVLGADLFAVRFAPGAEVTAQPALDEVARSYALEPATLDEVRATIGSALDRVFALLDGLALIALVVAALGIVNTLTMNVLERVREIGMLRAVGLTRRQVRRMVVLEAAILGLVGALVGVAAGVAAGALLALSTAGTPVVFDPAWPVAAAAATGAVAVAVIAAVYPARAAARLEIVRAVALD